MALMTVDEMREQLPIFKYKSRSAVHNFLRTREVQPVCRGEKKHGKGSGQNIYDPKVVQAAYDKHPIAGGGKVKRCLSYAQRKYKKPSEIDDFEFGGNVPFRNYMCPKYKECSDNFVIESFKKKRWSRAELDCSECEMKDEVDPDWRLK